MTSEEKIDIDLQKYFTENEWETMCEYEKLRCSNMKRNYEVMISIGLKPPRPQFMLQKKIIKCSKVVCKENDDDERGKLGNIFFQIPLKAGMEKTEDVCKSNSSSVKTSSRKNNAPSIKFLNVQAKCNFFTEEMLTSAKKHLEILKHLLVEAVDLNNKANVKNELINQKQRYPKRTIERKHYKEDDIPDDDDFIFCDDCEREYEGHCPVHGPLKLIEDKKVPKDGSVPKRALHTIPDSLSICRSAIKGAGSGVWTEIALPKGIVFGPYEGVITNSSEEAQKSGYCWQIYRNGKSHHYIDAKDISRSNWLRYVNCANNEEQQNLVAFQYKGDIYYRTYKLILPGTECLVWYGDEYAKELGISRENQNYEAIEDTARGYECEQCHAQFTSIDVLTSHKKHHWKTGLKHQCEFCPYSTDEKCNLLRHTLTHTGECPHKCQQCGKGFKQKIHLQHHLLTHTGERPHSCDFCGKRFALASGLRTHRRIHLQEKPYLCGFCDKAFTQQWALICHERVHTGQQLYKCPHCDQRFIESGAMKNHIICIHTHDFPHRCTHCAKGFIVPSRLKRHEQKAHSREE